MLSRPTSHGSLALRASRRPIPVTRSHSMAGPMRSRALQWAVASVPHPDGRPYPWLNVAPPQAGDDVERYLVIGTRHQQLCCQLAALEAGTTIARILCRTLVLPHPLAARGERQSLSDCFALEQLHQLVRSISMDELRATHRAKGQHDEPSVALCRICATHTLWCEANAVDVGFHAEDPCHPLGSGAFQLDFTLRLDAPLRGATAIRDHWGGLCHQILVLDDCYGAVAPQSVLDAGERELFAQALQPSMRLQRKLREFVRIVPRPFVAVRADLADDAVVAAHLSQTMDATRAKTWICASARSAVSTFVSAVAAGRADKLAESPAELRSVCAGEGVLGVEALHMWLCALADHFVGTARSLDSEYIRRLRVHMGKLKEHILAPLKELPLAPLVTGIRTSVELAAAPPPTDGAAQHAGDGSGTSPATHFCAICCGRSRVAARWRQFRRAASRGRIPWRLPHNCSSSRVLFEYFLEMTLPYLRQSPLCVAAPRSTANVAIIIEPRCHPALEYCVRNVARFLGGSWQMQIFHGTANAAFVRGLFSCDELVHVQVGWRESQL